MEQPSAALPLDIDALEQRVFNIFNECVGAQSSLSDSWSLSFIARYSEPQRHYHTTSHVAAMLDCLDRYRDKVLDVLAVELAIIFHDWIYEPQGKENEKESIVEFLSFAKQAGLHQDTSDKVSRLIEATIKHQIPEDLPSAEKNDISFFLDFDLEVLARDYSDYARYSEQIRKEYTCFNDEDYRIGRVRVLKSFLLRDRIFFSDNYLAAGEEIARENIRKEIEALETYE